MDSGTQQQHERAGIETETDALPAHPKDGNILECFLADDSTFGIILISAQTADWNYPKFIGQQPYRVLLVCHDF